MTESHAALPDRQSCDDEAQADFLRKWCAPNRGGRCALLACTMLALLPLAGGTLWLLA